MLMKKYPDYVMLQITDDMSDETKEQIKQANNLAGHLNYIHSKESNEIITTNKGD